MACNCNDTKSCCDMLDDLLEQIQSGLGQVDYDKINDYIDEQIAAFKEDLIAGDIEVKINEEDLLAKIKAALDDGLLDFDAYDVAYKDTNVGQKLDELIKTSVKFTGNISEFRMYEKGERLYNERLSWSFSKPLKSLTLGIYVNDMNTDTINLDPTATYYEIPELTATTKFTLSATSIDDENLVLNSDAVFALKYYVGCNGGTRLTNRGVLALSSYFAKNGVNTYNHVFKPIGRQYLWWVFPVDLHTDYDFFNNGFMDSNYVWEVGNVTNAHGYTSQYIFIRSGNPHTSNDIYTEVKAHEHI